MMAKTFDAVQQDTTSAIIFMRFKMALDYEHSASFMPPPFNVLAIPCLALFYVIEGIINALRYIVYFIGCKWYYCYQDNGKTRFRKYDFAVELMPAWMKKRKLELDEQILFEYPKGAIHDDHIWEIMTSEGKTKCKITDYKKETQDHYIKFYEHSDLKSELGTEGAQRKEFKRIEVSICNRIEKKHGWWVDLYDLRDDGLIDLNQFDNIKVNQHFTSIAHESMTKDGWKESPYWICAFCKGYVQRSDVSIKGLGRDLKVRDVEMKIIHKASPEICPNCYRVRTERRRWELVAEIISVWIFYIFIFPALWLVFALLMSLTCHRLHLCDKKDKNNSSSSGNDTDVKKKKKQKVRKAKLRRKTARRKLKNMDSEGQEEFSSDSSEYEYCTYHYEDPALMLQLKKEDDEEDALFDPDEPNELWKELYSAKDRIDTYLLAKKIDVHILKLSTEEELTPFEFNDHFIEMDAIRANNGQELWQQYFEPISAQIFRKIHDDAKDKLPLHLFARYPFDSQMIFHSMQQLWELEGRQYSVAECTDKDLVDALQKLEFLNCQNKSEREKIIQCIRDSTKYGTKKDKIYDKFINYLYTVQSLFQHPKKLKNMLRDVEVAIIERGVHSSVFQDQIYFLFEDIANSVESLPFFNSMRFEKIPDSGDVKLELWTIRNTLKCLYFLHDIVEKNILAKNSRIHVTKEEVLNIVYEQFEHDIKKPDDDDDDDHDEKNPNDTLFNICTKLRKTGNISFERSLSETPNSTLRFTDFTEYTNSANYQVQERPDSANYDDDEDNLYDSEKKADTLAELPEIPTKGNNNNNNNNNNPRLDSKRNLSNARSMLRVHDDMSDPDETEKQKQLYIKMRKYRLELFNKSEITQSAVKREISYIFDQIKKHRNNKITITSIDHYRQDLKAKLLKDDESLQYIFEQLSRHATFFPDKMKRKCDFNLLKRILIDDLDFGDHYIDTHVIPKAVKNTSAINQLYQYIKNVYSKAYSDKQVTLTLQDILAIIMVYIRIFNKLTQKMNENGDAFLVSHDVFCKFVDSKFKVDTPTETWTEKSKHASDLFQAVLDVQQQFVTLGQARQTIDKLIRDVEAMKTGELSRIMNYTQYYMNKDNKRCEDERHKWLRNKDRYYSSNKNLQKEPYEAYTNPDLDTEEEKHDMIHDKYSEKSSRKLKKLNKRSKSKSMDKPQKNPGLQFDHIDKKRWQKFIAKISQSFENNTPSSKFAAYLAESRSNTIDQHNNDNFDSSDDEDIKENELQNRYHSRKKPSVHHTHHAFVTSEKKIMAALLENTTFDIIGKQHTKSMHSKSNIKHKNIIKHKHVFDTVLSFNSDRITLQQLFQFSLDICLLLKRNKKIKKLLKTYQKIVDGLDEYGSFENKLKDDTLNRNFDEFFKEYFENKKQIKYKESKKSVDPNNFIAELKWFHETSKTKLDLCKRMHPFSNGKILKDICAFLESTEQIQGIYELKAAEFGQLKHSLNANDEEAEKLFHIIRFKLRSLTWKQFFLYFKFLLEMKRNVQKAISKSDQREDTTVSRDELKIQLKIPCNDESKWLFAQIEYLHGAKVTWKQIKNYISQMAVMRDSMKDFFGDMDRKRHYESNKADIISKMAKNVKDNSLKSSNKQNEMVDEMKELKKQNQKLRETLEFVQKQLSSVLLQKN